MTRRPVLLVIFMLSSSACDGRSGSELPAAMIQVAAGEYTLGSDSLERTRGYELSPPAVRRAGWYDRWESGRRRVRLDAYAIDRYPVTQAEYADFVSATGHRSPGITDSSYRAQGFLVHPYSEVVAYLWLDGRPPTGLLDHPVVLVDRADARAYCEWRGRREGLELRLPSEDEWEASCRGDGARRFAWGDEWVEGAARIRAGGTAPVSGHPRGATPQGVYELAGNVFEWTSSEMPDGRPSVKSCSWDDSPGTCRCAFRHGRPRTSRHILIGFRCALSR